MTNTDRYLPADPAAGQDVPVDADIPLSATGTCWSARPPCW
jgi:hypothetical protein